MTIPERAITLITISMVFGFLALLALIARICSRCMMKQKLSFNDYASILGMVFTLATLSVYLIATFNAGLGSHMRDLPPNKIELHLRLFVPGQILWAASNSCNKLSVISLYTVLFPRRVFREVCYCVMALTVCYFISVLLESFLLCHPTAYTWNKSIRGGYCVNANLAYLIAGITNLILDAIVVTMPMPILWGLQMPLARKLGVAGMFSLGAIICVISLQRVLWLKSWDLLDLTYTDAPGACWSALEPTLGVFSACLPTMRPVLQRLFGKNMFSGFKPDPNHSPIDPLYRKSYVGTSRLAMKSNKTKFEQLSDHEYPLMDLPPTHSHSSVSHGTTKLEFARQDDNSIQVTRSYDVQTTKHGKF